MDRDNGIFEMFVRGEAESSKPGVGLGLAICQAIVEAHEGTIATSTVHWGGACVTFTLPLGEPPIIERDPFSGKRAPFMGDMAAKVIVVEDEKQIRRFVRAALEEEGCRVFEAETSAQGLLEAGEQKPDLVVLDLGLP